MSNDYSQYYKESDVDADFGGRNEVKGRPFWTPESGGTDKAKVHRIRIMPPPANKTDTKFYTWVPQHSFLPGSNQPVLCPNRYADMPCPACQVAREYDRNGNEKMAAKFRATFRGLVNVLVLDGKGKVTPETRPLWWGMPKRTLEDLLAKMEEKAANGEDVRITSPRYGRDIFLRVTGKDELKRYEIQMAEQTTPWTKEMVEFLPKMNSLNTEEVYQLLPAASITKMLQAPQRGGFGNAPEEEEDFDAIFGQPDDAMDGVFRDVPQIAAGQTNDPFDLPDEPEEEDPFAHLPEEPDDEPPFDMPAQQVNNPAGRVAAAREALKSKIAAKA